MPVLAECCVENACHSHRASNGLCEEQRANLSTVRLGHQTGRNQLLRRERGGKGGAGVAAVKGDSFPLTFMHFVFFHKEKFSYFNYLLRAKEAQTVRQGME